MTKTTLISRDKIKNGLLHQLNFLLGGIVIDHYTDLIEKYMVMWDMALELESDFRVNGVKILSSTGSKINPSITEYTKTNNQMLRLLNELGLKPEKAEPEAEDY